jgi:hypothetical protein
LVPAIIGYVTSDKSPCNAWPNSWNSVRASSIESSAGAPSAAGEKFITLTTIGRMSPASFCWLRTCPIQAPLRFDGRAK